MSFLKKHYKYFIVAIGFLVFAFYVAAFIWPEYRDWKFWRDIRKEAAKFEQIREDREKAIANDIYGGKTPQETLDMFIAAVEKGDYELASKYFVVERQGGELEQLNKSDRKDIDNVINLLKVAKSKMSKENKTSKDTYVINDPILITFVKYPNGNWKINEI